MLCDCVAAVDGLVGGDDNDKIGKKVVMMVLVVSARW